MDPMIDQYHIVLALSPKERNLILKLLEADDSDLARGLRERIDYLLEEARAGAARDRRQKDRSRRVDAAHIVARVFAERHASSFPGSRGAINQNVKGWVEHQAEAALGVASDRNLPKIRPDHRPRVQMAFHALLDELRTPAGMRRAAAAESQRLRALATEWQAEPMYSDAHYNAKQCERLKAKADDLDRTGTIPGLLALRNQSWPE
jgi:hypothetical protein